MQITNYSKVSHNIGETKRFQPALNQNLQTKHSEVSMPVVPPAYFSPSFMGNLDYEDDGILCPKDPSQEYTFKVLRYDSKMNNPDYIFDGEERDAWLDFYLAKTGLLDEKLSNVYKLPGTKNSYRGQTIHNIGNETYGNLVEAGIKTIIDFSLSSNASPQLAEKHGLQYISFPIHNIMNPGHPLNLDKECTPRYRVDKLTDYISAMRKDNVYVCCLYGLNETRQGLLINEWFNPDRKLKKACGNSDLLEYVNDMYEILTDEDKEKMGWDEEFEEKFVKKLDEEYLSCAQTYDNKVF